MIIFPAIDLRGGRVVRLSEGDYDRMTVYSSDPVSVAMQFAEQGATHLHVVDLDAALTGEQANFGVISEIAAKSGMFVEVGGGGRSADSVGRYIEEAGVDRAIIGSAAITNPGFLEDMAARFPGKIAAGIDAKGGKVAIHGWREVTDIDALAYLGGLPERGISVAIYTDISRDGLLTGANIPAYRAADGIPGLHIIASGGVTHEADVSELAALGIYGAIIGKAIYAGVIDIKRAIDIGRDAI